MSVALIIPLPLLVTILSICQIVTRSMSFKVLSNVLLNIMNMKKNTIVKQNVVKTISGTLFYSRLQVM